jgi:hypothetical protein
VSSLLAGAPSIVCTTVCARVLAPLLLLPASATRRHTGKKKLEALFFCTSPPFILRRYPAWVYASLGSLMWASLVSNSLVVLTLVVLVYNLVNASIISMVLPIVLLLVVLTHYPRAPTASLRFMFRYVCGVVVLKFTFQLPIFCENMAVNHQSGIITTGQWCVRAYVRTYVAAARLWRLSFNDLRNW